MKTILISAFTILILVAVYFLFFYQSSNETTRITESKIKNSNAKLVSNRMIEDQWGKKLSMKQIDSITALINYNFTSQNYNKDVVPPDSAELKNKKL
jgi:hypothetical protein